MSTLDGIRWSVSQRLGVRSIDPPARSEPAIELTLTTTTASGSKENIGIKVTAEQANDILITLQDMLKTAQRITKH